MPSRSGIDPKTGRWDWSLGRLCFLDAETTGIWKPEAPPLPLILEVAAIVTDRALNELGRYAAVVDYRDLSYLTRTIPFVVDMHIKSGLWEALQRREGTVSLEEIERDLCQLVKDTSVVNGTPDTRPVIWAGFSPSALDRPAIRHYMPSFYSLLHYRTLDVSTLNLVARNYAQANLERDDAEHRAEPDAQASLEFFRRFCSLIERKARRRDKLEPSTASVN